MHSVALPFSAKHTLFHLRLLTILFQLTTTKINSLCTLLLFPFDRISLSRLHVFPVDSGCCRRLYPQRTTSFSQSYSPSLIPHPAQCRKNSTPSPLALQQRSISEPNFPLSKRILMTHHRLRHNRYISPCECTRPA